MEIKIDERILKVTSKSNKTYTILKGIENRAMIVEDEYTYPIVSFYKGVVHCTLDDFIDISFVEHKEKLFLTIIECDFDANSEEDDETLIGKFTADGDGNWVELEE